MAVLRSKDVAQMVGVSKETIRNWCKLGVGPRFIKTPGGHHLFQEEHVLDFMRSLEGESLDRVAA